MAFVSFNTEVWRNKLDPATMTVDALVSGGGEALANWKKTNGAAYLGPAVRRPLNGLTIKERTPASLSVIRKDGTPIMLNNMLGGEGTDYTWLSEYSGAPEKNPVTGASANAYYTDFSIFQLQESREERMQVIETFGENFVFFFGERPRFLSMGGILANTRDFPWRSIWWENYDKYLRGTKCVENRARVYLAWDDVLVEGYIVSSSATDSSSDPNQIPFNFTMLLTKHTSLTATNMEVVNKVNALSGNSGRQSEILGSLRRELEVYNNGSPIELDEPTLLEQIMAKFGLDKASEAYELLKKYGAPLSDSASLLFGNIDSNVTGLVNMTGGQTVYGTTSPLGSIWDGMATIDANTGESSVEGTPTSTLTSLDATRKVFGAGLNVHHSLDWL